MSISTITLVVMLCGLAAATQLPSPADVPQLSVSNSSNGAIQLSASVLETPEFAQLKRFIKEVNRRGVELQSAEQNSLPVIHSYFDAMPACDAGCR